MKHTGDTCLLAGALGLNIANRNELSILCVREHWSSSKFKAGDLTHCRKCDCLWFLAFRLKKVCFFMLLQMFNNQYNKQGDGNTHK